MKKEARGITLVALVITIIILLILATISIQALTQTGLFESANKAKLENKRGQISETLELKEMLEQSNNPTGTAEEIITATRNNVIQNKSELEKIGKNVQIEEISTEEDGEKVDVYFYVVVDKDVYKVDMSGTKFIGELGKFKPVIKIKKLTNTTNSITIEVKTSRNEGGKLEYYIKAEDEDKYELKETKTDDSEYTYGDLIQGKKYNIKVIAKAENGQTAEATAEQTTGNVTNLTTGDIIFTYMVNENVIDKNTWTNGTVKVSAKINPEIDMTGLKIQTSKDGKNYENTDEQSFTENGTMYVVLTDGKNYGGSAGGAVTNIDKTAPTVPIITYNSGSNECKWKNNINITLTSTDTQSGIAYFQVDWDGDGISNGNVDANFIPWNGYSSCNNRFRAVDNVGNASEWTSTVHLHMDTEAPVHTNWWWGEVNANVARLYIQATDNVGIARVTAPTSTQSGGYNNWVWFDAVWDAGANAYRADITPSTFGHYGQTYLTHLYIWDSAGNGGYCNATNVNIPTKINYGTSIQSSYGTLYTTTYPTGNIPKVDMDTYTAGNYDRGYYLLSQTQKEAIMQNTSGKGYAYVYSGDNKYNFTEQVSNRWIGIHFHGTEWTTAMNISNVKIYFSDNTSYTIREAVNQGYIEPLVICESMHTYAEYTIWTNILNILDGNATSTNNYPDGLLMFKVKERANITAISFYTNKDWSTSYADGLRVYKYYDGFEISTQPIS